MNIHRIVKSVEHFGLKTLRKLNDELPFIMPIAGCGLLIAGFIIERNRKEDDNGAASTVCEAAGAALTIGGTLLGRKRYKTVKKELKVLNKNMGSLVRCAGELGLVEKIEQEKAEDSEVNGDGEKVFWVVDGSENPFLGGITWDTYNAYKMTKSDLVIATQKLQRLYMTTGTAFKNDWLKLTHREFNPKNNECWNSEYMAEAWEFNEWIPLIVYGIDDPDDMIDLPNGEKALAVVFKIDPEDCIEFIYEEETEGGCFDVR